MRGSPQIVPPQGTGPDTPEILVATDGSAAAGVAVQYALDLGVERSCPVRIVHVVPSHVPVPEGLRPSVAAAGVELLEDVARRARLAAPTVDVRTSLLHGSRGLELISAARGAGVVVLGRSSGVSHVITGSTASALIELTDRPVRVVPPEWFRRSARSEVVVGVKDPRTSHALVERGFELAGELGESLVLLHAWGLPTGYEEVVALADTDEWNTQLTERMQAEVAPIRARHPDVPYEIRIVHGRAARALEVASRRASFLLLGRPANHHPVGVRTDVAHVLVNVSECLVEVGPESRAPAPVMDLVLEAHGHLLR